MENLQVNRNYSQFPKRKLLLRKSSYQSFILLTTSGVARKHCLRFQKKNEMRKKNQFQPDVFQEKFTLSPTKRD